MARAFHCKQGFNLIPPSSYQLLLGFTCKPSLAFKLALVKSHILFPLERSECVCCTFKTHLINYSRVLFSAFNPFPASAVLIMGPGGVGEIKHAYSLFISCSSHKNFTYVLYLPPKSVLAWVLEYVQGAIPQTGDFGEVLCILLWGFLFCFFILTVSLRAWDTLIYLFKYIWVPRGCYFSFPRCIISGFVSG